MYQMIKYEIETDEKESHENIDEDENEYHNLNQNMKINQDGEYYYSDGEDGNLSEDNN